MSTQRKKSNWENVSEDGCENWKRKESWGGEYEWEEGLSVWGRWEAGLQHWIDEWVENNQILEDRRTTRSTVGKKWWKNSKPFFFVERKTHYSFTVMWSLLLFFIKLLNVASVTKLFVLRVFSEDKWVFSEYFHSPETWLTGDYGLPIIVNVKCCIIFRLTPPINLWGTSSDNYSIKAEMD